MVNCSSVVIDHLQVQPNRHGLAYAYFDYKEQERQKPIQVLSSLLKQLIGQAIHLPFPTEIKALYSRHETGGGRPTFEELYAALMVVSKQFPQVYFVFDALDGCHPENQRRTLLPLFQRMGREGINVS